MSFDVNNIPFAYLIQPELLEEQDIKRILIERCVHIHNIERLNKDQLLSIYYRVVMPLQQRTRNELRKDVDSTKCTVISQKNGILKPTSDENKAKKLKLSLSPHKVQLKRPITEKNMNEDVSVVKKARQKITWP